MISTGPDWRRPQVPLSARPEIVQTGMGEHYGPRTESFRFTDIWQLHLYFWRGVFRVGSECFEVGPEIVSLLPPGPEVTWQFPQGKCDHYFIHFRLTGKRRLKAIPTVIPVRSHYDLILSLIHI